MDKNLSCRQDAKNPEVSSSCKEFSKLLAWFITICTVSQDDEPCAETRGSDKAIPSRERTIVQRINGMHLVNTLISQQIDLSLALIILDDKQSRWT